MPENFRSVDAHLYEEAGSVMSPPEMGYMLPVDKHFMIEACQY